MMDDPIEREKAMAKLFTLQAQANKGENLSEIEAIGGITEEETDPKDVLEKAKETA